MADLIDRKAAIEIASGYCHPANIVAELEKLPSAQPERKTGRWIINYLCSTSGGSYRVYRCSECEAFYESAGLWPRRYCPSCGAKMDEEVRAWDD